MGRGETRLKDDERSPIQRLGAGMLPRRCRQHGEVVEGHGDVGMVRPQELLFDHQGAAV